MKVKIIKAVKVEDETMDKYYHSQIGKIANVVGIDDNMLVLDIPQFCDNTKNSYWRLSEVEFYEK